jgi:hypothetical protein
VELANLAVDTLDEVIAAAERGIQRIRDTHHPGLLVPAPLRPVAVVTTSLGKRRHSPIPSTNRRR